MKRRAWTDIEVSVLRQHYPDTPSATLAQALERPVCEIYRKANALGLRKTAAYMASEAACRLRRGDNIGIGTQFRKGQDAWNKGLHYTPGGRCAETQFRPGQKPHTWHPIGHERLTKEGYLQRKMTDTGVTRRDYVAVHHLVWIAAHGPIPPGHAVAFKDGDKTRIELDNLELISRADLMRRNTRHNLPKPVADVIALRAALNRKINQLRRNAHEQQQHD